MSPQFYNKKLLLPIVDHWLDNFAHEALTAGKNKLSPFHSALVHTLTDGHI